MFVDLVDPPLFIAKRVGDIVYRGVTRDKGQSGYVYKSLDQLEFLWVGDKKAGEAYALGPGACLTMYRFTKNMLFQSIGMDQVFYDLMEGDDPAVSEIL